MTNPDIVDLVRRIAGSPKNPCFACGQYNPVGLHLRFEPDGNLVRSSFTPGPLHHGWQNAVHGGILATMLDEAMAYALFFRGIQAVTARLEIRYRAAVQHGEALSVEAELRRESGRIADVEGRVTRNGQIVAEASGRFMKVGSTDDLLAAAGAAPERESV